MSGKVPADRHGDLLDWLYEHGKQRARRVPEFDVERTISRAYAARDAGAVNFWSALSPAERSAFESAARKQVFASGTALMLGRAAAEGRGVNLAQRSVRGRDGMTGARCAGDIGFAALRGGTVVGEHSVIFAGPAERVELTHRAEDRMIFARGALHAALWARGKKPGLYSMADVLGLSDI